MYRVPPAPRGSRRAGLVSVAVLVLLGVLFSGSSDAARLRGSGGADYPAAGWAPASGKNFQRADRPLSSPITRIVIHTTEGSSASAIRFFEHAGAIASADFVISSGGAITQMVHERDIAWHAGNRAYNASSIGIEHEAFVHDCSSYTSALYRSSARLVAYLTRKYGIPIDRRHIIGHYQVPDPFHPGEFGGWAHHTDPGPCWNWGKYMRLVRADAGPVPSQRTEDQVVDGETHAGFKAPGWRRRRPDSEQLLGPTYSVARPSGKAAPASFRLAIPAGGDYAIYAWWPADRHRNPAVPFGVSTITGWHWQTVNERTRGGRWAYLGTFTLPAGSGWDVRVSRDSSARGSIAAEAVTAEPVGDSIQSRLLPGGFGYTLTASELALTNDAGSTWRAATPPDLAATDIRAVYFADPANGFVVARSGPDGRSFALSRTTDGGLTWTTSRLPLPAELDAAAPVALAAPDASHLFISLSLQQGLALRGPGVLLASPNGGRTWTRQVLPGNGEIEFTTAARGWLAAAAGGLYRTHDGGRTWRPVAVPEDARFRPTPPLADLPTFSDPTHAVLPATFLRGKRATVAFLTTSNSGTTWRTAASATSNTAARVPVAIADASHWIALPGGGARVVTLVGGKPSRSVATAGLPLTAPGFALENVSFASTSTGWATISTCAAGAGARCARRQSLYRTVDGGATWAPLNVPSASRTR